MGTFLLRQKLPHRLSRHASSFSVPIAVILAGQNAIRQRSPSQDAQIESLRHGNQLPFYGAFNEVVFNMNPRKTRPAAEIRKRIRLRNPPRRSIRNPCIEDLALASSLSIEREDTN